MYRLPTKRTTKRHRKAPMTHKDIIEPVKSFILHPIFGASVNALNLKNNDFFVNRQIEHAVVTASSARNNCHYNTLTILAA